MLTNKDIINAYKRRKVQMHLVKHKHINYLKMYIIVILICLLICLPTISIELYFKRSFLQLVSRTLIAFISHWLITFLILSLIFKKRVLSNHASSLVDNMILATFIIGFIPQIIYVIIYIIYI